MGLSVIVIRDNVYSAVLLEVEAATEDAVPSLAD